MVSEVTCTSCGSVADDPKGSCPECGYAPGRALVVSGLAYAALGSVLALGAIALLVNLIDVGAVGVLLSALAFYAGIAVSYYGMYLLAMGVGTPVNEDLDAYLLPVPGKRSIAMVGSASSGGRRRVDDSEGSASRRGETVGPGVEGREDEPIECRACESVLEDATTRCPNCGYYPKRTLVASGLSYTALGNVLVVVGIGLPFLIGSVVGLSSGFAAIFLLFGTLLGVAVSVYGISMAFGGRNANIRENFDEYVLPVLWRSP